MPLLPLWAFVVLSRVNSTYYLYMFALLLSVDFKLQEEIP